jgi:NADP-dependent 3-hydroxy acid dehydrogenase YdfG
LWNCRDFFAFDLNYLFVLFSGRVSLRRKDDSENPHEGEETMPILNWLITGASNGLGLALTLEVLQAGHKVIATARDVTKASAAHPEIERLGGTWLQLDVNKSDTKTIVENAVRDIFSGRIDVLVNNAGYSILGSIEDLRWVE